MMPASKPLPLKEACEQFSTARAPARLEVLASDIPVLLLVWPTNEHFRPSGLGEALNTVARDVFGTCNGLFRGIDADQFDKVRSGGVDVDPFWAADDPQKALEYGGWPKVILLVDRARVQRSFEEVSATAPVERLEELRTRYATEIPTDGSMLWFTTFPAGDRRAATNYERAYGFSGAEGAGRLLYCVVLLARNAEEERALRRITEV